MEKQGKNCEDSPAGIENVYSTYKCEKDHVLVWKGYKLGSKSYCRTCNKNSKLVFSCEECKVGYCDICKPLVKLLKCPIKHEIKFMKDFSYGSYISFRCNLCFKILSGKNDVYLDEVCDAGFCFDCGKD